MLRLFLANGLFISLFSLVLLALPAAAQEGWDDAPVQGWQNPPVSHDVEYDSETVLEAPSAVPAVENHGVAATSSAGETAAQAAPTDERVLDPRAGTYDLKEMVSAADSALGSASESVARVVEKVFADMGEPNGYIVGREGSGALFIGLRYGAGTLYSKVEGERRVHWTGPSFGPDIGGDASRTFTLVYHLDDTEDLFHRYPAVEGRAYLIGGVSANYHQRGNVVVVPIRLGAGLRLGANVGYIKYSKEGRILPF